MSRARGLGRRAALFAAVFTAAAAATAAAHPLGNFTINQYARLEAGVTGVRVRFVVDMAEIPTLQELPAADRDGDGRLSEQELADYAERAAADYAAGLALAVDGAAVPLSVEAARAELRPGAGGLEVLRVEADMRAAFPGGAAPRAVDFANRNLEGRLGWRELVVSPAPGAAVFDSTAFGSGVTDELNAYPEGLLMAPLDERTARFSVAAGAVPDGATPLRTRDGAPVAAAADRFADLIAVPEITPITALLGLLLAAGLGAVHALTPGHGKTVVGAYLVGSRGTARHAAFLGLTVTVTHTAGVFALGLLTLFASQYVLPERIFPVLSVASGAIVLALGLGLFASRLRAALGAAHEPHGHSHDHGGGEHGHAHAGHREHAHSHDGGHAHGHDHGIHTHAHGGRAHSHLPPGADGAPVTWRSLLALGVSGGLLPCPSALVVLLAAVALDRVAYGLLLVVAFSAGLAAVLTGVGLAFVYARRLVGFTAAGRRVATILPAASAAVIACVGAVLLLEALAEAGYGLTALAAAGAAADEPTLHGIGALGVLGLGLVYGLKHATEADHVIAVSTIVSEHRKLRRAALVGGLWGVGHTASLVAVGAVVLALRVAIPDAVATWLEFCVALMIVGLGAGAVVRGLRRRSGAHVHEHTHDGVTHAHVHFHDDEGAHDGPAPHSHAVRRIGLKPLAVGAMHGLAGSAALTLLVLTEIQSPVLGMLYLLVFGAGSVGGMLAMSGLVGIPFALTASGLGRFHHVLQILAGAFSIAFGVWYAYETGAVESLLAARFL